ncbi:MAG: type I restriction-modification enzyme R subunit C-terminal domain-containing protein [Capsulimonas sp.]|uniref:type I restriction endonuclease subunit R n=1 Tax=Capsulimonas sp. TaxID=2494211 RepID=UPI003263032B
MQDANAVNLAAGPGVAIREMPMAPGFGAADYLLYVNRKALGVVEAKKLGETLTGVEVQTEKYSEGLPASLPAWRRPLSFLYQSTGAETRFTNALDPDPRSRTVFNFHRPETLHAWAQGKIGIASASLVFETSDGYGVPSTLQRRLRRMPPLVTDGMRPAQIRAIQKLEVSLAENRPRALIQMSPGSGKTFCAVAEVYRLIKFGGVKRVLLLVDRANLARQALNEFQQYITPDDGRKFTELYNVQHLRSNTIDPVSRVCITTIQRLYSILKGDPDFDPNSEEESAGDEISPLRREPLPVVYNALIPPEMFDVVYIDECHRSIYNLWRQALDYWDAYLIGMTATPSKQTLAFFNQNLVSEYGHAQAVSDGVNVDFDVYRIKTQITESGSKVEAGLWVDTRNRKSRRVRWREVEEDLTYTPNELDRAVVAEDQIRTVIRTFKNQMLPETFPDRTQVPKTLVFAKDDSHADDIVRILREEFGKGNNFCEKITYRTSTARIVDPETGSITYKNTGIKPEDLLSSFRNSYNPRIAVTVDMIATGTDVRPLEIVFFMRDVKSGNYFEQMKGRGSRVVSPDELRAVTGDATSKTRFVIVDAVGVCEREHVDAPSLERKPTVSLKELLKAVGMGSTHIDVVSTLASRLARLARQMTPAQTASLAQATGHSLPELIGALAASVDPDVQEARAQARFLVEDPTPEQIEEVAEEARMDATAPFLPSEVRKRIEEIQQDDEQVIDRLSKDTVLSAGVSEEAKQKARATVESFAAYLDEHRNEITALQVLYSRPHGQGPTLKQLKELAEKIQNPPLGWTPDTLWNAYRMIEGDKVCGRSAADRAADLVSLVRFALHQDPTLAPFAETVAVRFSAWLTQQEAAGVTFTPEQVQWLEMVRDHVAQSLSMDTDDFDNTPFSQQGGLWRAHTLFGDRLTPLLEELNGVLVT